MKSIGIEKISKERIRQIEKEWFSSSHDDKHVDGELAIAAACFAASAGGIESNIEFPWEDRWDKRPKAGEELTTEKRIDLLVKAGALIAAEIDRLNRI